MARNKVAINKTSNTIVEDPTNLVGASDGSEYYLRKNRNYRITVSPVKDEVDGIFTINFKKPLPELNTAFGKAYSADQKFGLGDEIYCLILDKRYPIRLAEINKLANKTFENMVNLLGVQLITSSISKGRVLAVILEKPIGITVSEYMKKKGAINSDYITRTLVPKIGETISNMAQIGVTHGRINVDNLYVGLDGRIVLGECISEPCGYSQPIIYETVNRAVALPIGKGTGNTKDDYHALGVLVAIILRGKDPTEGLDKEDIINKKFEEGTYKIVTSGLEISTQVLDFLRGMLANRKNEVWGSIQLQEWVRGRRFNLLPPADIIEDGRPLLFNGKKYISRKHLVHSMHRNWEDGKKFVKKDTIIRWISRNPHENELVELLEMASGQYGREKVTPGFDQDDETLAQYILLLDPTGPFRLKEFSAHVDGIGVSLADGFANNKTIIIDIIENIISYNLQLLIPNKEGSIHATHQEAIFTLQKCFELLRKKDLGFGIERCLYELNPTLPCQGVQVIEEMAFTIDELIKILDTNESIGGAILDKQMSAFLSERMDLMMKVHLSSLSRFPTFSANINIQVLALLSLAQQTSNVGNLPKLSAKICESLKNVLIEFHSKTIRADLEDALKKASKKGVLANLLRVITDPKYLVRDHVGFKKAVSSYKNNSIQIIKFSNTKVVNNVGYRYGLQLAVMISFFVATVEIIVLLIKAF